MTDYDDVRTCCQGASVCRKCWQFMEIAVNIVDQALREDFGFKSMMWVFSGWRGIHCWVSDKEALDLTNEGWSAIADYLSVYVGNELTGGIAKLKLPLHPSLVRAAKILRRWFLEVMIEGQQILQNESHRTKILTHLLKDSEAGFKTHFIWEFEGCSADADWWKLV